MEKYDLDELDDLLDEDDLMEYQVILEGYDENDNPVNYYEVIKVLKDEYRAVSIDEAIELLPSICRHRRKYNIYWKWSNFI